MRRRIVRYLMPLALAGMLAGIAGPAQAAAASVNVIDFAFQPASVKAQLGGSVDWTFDSANTENHTSTDTSGMGLWDSGSEPPGASFSFAFTAAGTYSYDCTIHTFMKGTVKVPMKATPATGTTTTQFKIQWATITAPAGFVYDVQIQRPTGGGFVNWMTGVTINRGRFTPDAGAGTYAFRARLHKTSNNKASGYSAAAKITVS